MPVCLKTHVTYARPSPKAPERSRNGSALPRVCKRWSAHDDNLVRAGYDPFNVTPLAVALGRTEQAVRTRASGLKITMTRQLAATLSKKVYGSEWSA